MLDEGIRKTERRRLAEDDPVAVTRWRQELLRTGREDEVADVLTIDVAEHAGYALGSVGKTRIASGVLDVRLLDGEHPGARYRRFTNMIRLLATKRGLVRVLAWERVVSHGSFAANAILYSLESRLVELAWELEIEPRSIMPATLKKAATGRGDAKKERMVEVAEERWKVKVKRHDEADALCILGWVFDSEATKR